MSNIKKVKFLTTSFGGNRYRLIYTGLTGPVNLEILESVKGQLSDGIWENSPSMVKVWRNFSVVNKGGVIFLNVDNYYPSPFADKTDQEVLKYFAIKIKQIIKVEQDDGYDVVWERNCKEISAYFGNRDTHVTVADAYKAYDTLLGRATVNKKYESVNKPLVEVPDLDSDNSNIDIDQFFSRGGGNIWADCDKYTLRRNCKKEPDIRWALFKGDDWTSRDLVLVLPFTSLNEMMNFEYSLPEVCWKGSFLEDEDYPEDTPETSDLYFDEIIKRFGKGKDTSRSLTTDKSPSDIYLEDAEVFTKDTDFTPILSELVQFLSRRTGLPKDLGFYLVNTTPGFPSTSLNLEAISAFSPLKNIPILNIVSGRCQYTFSGSVYLNDSDSGDDYAKPNSISLIISLLFDTLTPNLNGSYFVFKLGFATYHNGQWAVKLGDETR